MSDTKLEQRVTNLSRGLVAVGGLNWGLVGLLRFDLVARLFGKDSPLSRAVYTAVGAATAYTVIRTARTPAGRRPVRAGPVDHEPGTERARLPEVVDAEPDLHSPADLS